MFETLEALDRALLLKINALHNPFLDVLMWYISQSWPTVLLVLIISYTVYRKFHARKAMEFLVGCAIVFACTDLSSNAMKHGVKRYRPSHNHEIREKVRILRDYSGGKYGFFSGHAANTFGVVTFIFLFVSWMSRRHMWIIGAYPFLVVYSRMYLGVHYPSDIIIGMLDGLLFGWLVFTIMNMYFFKLDEPKV
jgi:undecaprenyl-diphosphatase